MNNEQRLSEIRQQIDDIDQKLQELINQRANLAVEVGSIKKESDAKTVFYRPEREAQILQNIIQRNRGPLSTQQVTLIFRNILTACLTLQHPIRVATLGPEGTFSQAATCKHFGIATDIILTTHIEDIFQAVETEKADYGVVPIENSTTGVINQVLDILRISPLKICGEIILPVHHHLLVQEATGKDIHCIYAHGQAFLQCDKWLAQNLPSVECITVSSNGEAAKRAKQEIGAAAIAGDFAAQEYDLTILEQNIQDNPLNKTRFLILGRQKVGPSQNDKTSLLIATPHTPGALVELLKPFADQQINISLIESRPSQDCNWAYYFFIDIDGHQEDAAVKQALAKLINRDVQLHVLGSYPKAVV